nr:B335 [uncultured bacterium]
MAACAAGLFVWPPARPGRLLAACAAGSFVGRLRGRVVRSA